MFGSEEKHGDPKDVELVLRILRDKKYEPTDEENQRLSKLEKLDLSYLSIDSLDRLEKLINLRELYLENTQVSDLKPLEGLTNLEILHLGGTKIKSLESLASLKKLERLGISSTSIDAIPKFLVDKNIPFITNGYMGIGTGVFMMNAELSTQPYGLFKGSRELIEAYYAEKPVNVNEVKVIFLGDGGVGKTHTICRLKDGKDPETTETTAGVNITSVPRDGQATINYWDFGGQEIMHSMHRCFLTNRTCYVIVVSNRWSDVTKQARRWLKTIESFASDSTVLLAVNRWEGVPAWDLDKGRLTREFPNLVKIVEYTAKTHVAEDFKGLKDCIESIVKDMPSVHMKLPKSWASVFDKLRNMTDNNGNRRNYIGGGEFKNKCREAGINNRELQFWLLRWLNDLGVCFSTNESPGAIPDCMILNPIWLTNAIYAFVNNGGPMADSGYISHEKLLAILKEPKYCDVEEYEYDEKELGYVLQVMRYFQLSYKAGNKEFIPALCLNNMPEGVELKEGEYLKRVRCEIRYDYLPNAVVHRLLISLSARTDRLEGVLDCKKSWLKGVCIDERDNLGILAVCDMGRDDDVLRIVVYQVCEDIPEEIDKTPQRWLRYLLKKIEAINKKLALKSTTWICSDDERRASFQASSLFTAYLGDVTTIPYTEDGGYTVYEVQTLLEQIFDNIFKGRLKEKIYLLKKQLKTNEQGISNTINNIVLNYEVDEGYKANEANKGNEVNKGNEEYEDDDEVERVLKPLLRTAVRNIRNS